MTNTTLSLMSAEALSAYTEAGYWRDNTIYDLVRLQALNAPGRIAVRDRRMALTYQQLIDCADILCADLFRRGVRAGQRVAVWLPSSVETVIAILACNRGGYVCCPALHRDHTVAEVHELVSRMNAAAVFAQPGYGADAGRHDLSCIRNLSTVQHLYCVETQHLGSSLPFEKLIVDAKSPYPSPNKDPNTVAYLAFTSGTTQQPKGVMHTDNTLLASARALAKDWQFDSATRIYTLSPLSHNLGFGALITSIVAGGELILHDVVRGESICERLLKTEASFLFGVPTHAVDLLQELRARGAKRLGSVRGFRISGAACTPEVLSELMEYEITPQSGYGMTETCSHQYTLPSDTPATIAETCGRACAGYEIRIWRQDDPNTEAEIGQVGEIGGRGASLMLGYFNDQTSTENSFNASGWFMTGDLGSLDARGYLRITGRKKDVIIRGGHNIYPFKLESLALQHPQVEKAVAFAMPDPRLGERVCLALVWRNGDRHDDGELLDFLDSAGLSKYDMPEYLLELDAVPMTASGKVLKRLLSARIAAGELSPRPVKFRAFKSATN